MLQFLARRSFRDSHLEEEKSNYLKLITWWANEYGVGIEEDLLGGRGRN